MPQYSSSGYAGTTRDGSFVQAIPGRNINQDKLQSLLNSRWDKDYTVEMRANVYRVTAPGKLSATEIRRCS